MTLNGKSLLMINHFVFDLKAGTQPSHGTSRAAGLALLRKAVYFVVGLQLGIVLAAYGAEDPTPAGTNVFDESRIHTVDLSLSTADWQSIIDDAAAYENNNTSYPYLHARLVFDGEALDDDIGVCLKGHISIELTEGHSYPLKLDFNRYEKSQRLDGLKKLNLNTDFNGPTLPIMRDYLSYEAWRVFGVPASRTSFARVTVNGEGLGIYVLLEQVNGGFVKRHFEEPYGDLYKPEQMTGSLEYRGPDIAEYPDIGLKWPDESDHASLLHALEVLNSGTMDELAQVFDVNSVLTYLAGNIVLGSWDSYPYTAHNYYLYEASPGCFTMLPWDMNGSQEPEALSLCRPLEGILSGRLLREPIYQAKYFDILRDFLETTGSADWLIARLNAAQDLLGSEISAEEVEGLRQDIRTRTARLRAELDSMTWCE